MTIPRHARSQVRPYGAPVVATLLLALLSGGFSSMALAAQPVPAELKLAIGSEPTEGFDPLLGWSHGSYLLLHSPLLKQIAGDSADLSWQDLLTQAVTPNKDGKGWLITLKPGLKFSNGAPLTAEDVAFTYNSAAQGGGKIDMGNFVKAEVVSPTEVAIVLSAPQSTFVNVLGSLGIVSKKDYDAKAYACRCWPLPAGELPARPAAGGGGEPPLRRRQQ